MRHRRGLTLVEMLVSVALVLFIMVILTEAFGKGLESFRTLKAQGDLEAQLRAATALLRRDLAADHFDGGLYLSDSAERLRMRREGFFRVFAPGTNQLRPGIPRDQFENRDADGLESMRVARHVLHFTIKLRGNSRDSYLSARVPPDSPLLATGLPARPTTHFNLPAEARFEDTPGTYSSQWAEVAYWLEPAGATPGAVPLFTLYRSQFVVVADNTELNWPAVPVPGLVPVPATDANLAAYAEMSWRPVPREPGQVPTLHFNNPSDLYTPANRTFNPLAPTMRAAAPLLHHVVSFRVESPNSPESRETVTTASMTITLRVYDVKTRQARQVTIVQSL